MTPADLKAWRAEQGLTQPALAALLGVHEVTLSRWERGERQIPPFLPLALARLGSDNCEQHPYFSGGCPCNCHDAASISHPSGAS